jgi:hypothetical protein
MEEQLIVGAILFFLIKGGEYGFTQQDAQNMARHCDREKDLSAQVPCLKNSPWSFNAICKRKPVSGQYQGMRGSTLRSL